MFLVCPPAADYFVTWYVLYFHHAAASSLLEKCSAFPKSIPNTGQATVQLDRTVVLCKFAFIVEDKSKKRSDRYV